MLNKETTDLKKSYDKFKPDTSRIDQCADALLEAANTASARPVKRETTPVGDYRCPNCNAAFIEALGRTNYCGNCGQKLDWSMSSDEK
jgi:hypothetical protein